MMKKKTLSYILLTFFIIFLVYYINKNVEQFKPLTKLNPLYLVAIAICHLIVIYMNGLFIKYILVPYKKEMGAGEGFFVALISTIGNYFLPAGTGVGVKAVYLKKKFDITYSDFLSTLSGNYILVFMINSGLGLLAAFMLRGRAPAAQENMLMLVLGAIFIGMLVLATYGFPKKIIRYMGKSKFLSRFTSVLSTVLQGWNEIIKDRLLLFRLTYLSLINFLFYCLVTYLAILALGFEVSIWALVLYATLASLSLLLNITPGSIGLREAVLILVSATLGLAVSQILSISIVVNGVQFFVLIAAWALLQIGPIKRKLVPPAIQSQV